VKAFLDTSVLVAAFYYGHEHHQSSFELFLKQDKKSGCTGAHSLAEVYSALTGMPGKDRASGDEALLFLGNVRDPLTIVGLDAKEYITALEAAARRGCNRRRNLRRDSRTLRAEGERGDHLHLEREALCPPRRRDCRPRQNAVARWSLRKRPGFCTGQRTRLPHA
jgi:predicted nucleic acid-binding protein